MSLLMEALRRAEEAKRASQTDTGGETISQAGLALEPVPITQNTEWDDAARQAQQPVNTPAPAARAAQQQARSTAQNVFTAKRSKTQPAFPVIIGASVAAAVLVIGAYLWWQLQPRRPAAASAPIV